MDEITGVAMAMYVSYLREIDERNISRGQHCKDTLLMCGPTYIKYFMDAAKRCRELGMNPDEFIRTAFSKVQKNNRYITPKDIVNANNVVSAWQHQRTSGLRVATQWNYMVTELGRLKVHTIPKPYSDIVDILLDPMQPFTAYFRVLYPSAIYEDLFVRYHNYAYDELASDKNLRAYLRKIRGAQLTRFEELTRPFSDRILEGEYNG